MIEELIEDLKLTWVHDSAGDEHFRAQIDNLINAVRDQAYDEGYKIGYNEGYKIGFDEGTFEDWINA